jgi:hypothetical protein
LSERYERIGTLRFRRRSSNVSPVPASPTRSK